MDVQDVSFVEDNLRSLMKLKENATLAAMRKGEIPRDHPLPFFLIEDFMARLKMREATIRFRQKGEMDMVTTAVPEPYPPCTLPAAELNPITISQMKLETHHRGRSIVVRVITPPDRMTNVMALIEDEKYSVVLLQLYNQPAEATVPKHSILRKDGVMLIKEPFFKVTASGGNEYSIRVDHVSDVIFLDALDPLVPKRLRMASGELLGMTSKEIRKEGNAAVGKKEWAEAERLYSASIEEAETPEDTQLAHLNRSLVNLRLGRPANALSDAAFGGNDKGEKPNEKAFFRKASALYDLRKFSACLEVLQDFETAFPVSDAAKSMMNRVKQRVCEQETGEYDFNQMYKQAKSTPPLIDCATYSAPVEVRLSPGRGRGLFTTKKVSAGELLICEKALGYAYSGPESTKMTMLINMETKKMTCGGQADLLTQLVQKLYHDPEAMRAFGELYHGDYKPVAFSEVDGRPVVDTFLVEKVISLISFGCPRTNRAELYKKNSDQSIVFDTCGVWPLISYINHACIHNCFRSFIGDMQIVRATQDLEPGTELFFWYTSPVGFRTYEEFQKLLKSWGFVCTCTLCLVRKTTTKTTIGERKKHWNTIQRIMLGGNSAGVSLKPAEVKKLKKVLKQLDATYSAEERAPGAVRLELLSAYVALGEAMRVKGDCAEAIEWTVKGLETLGFILTACPPRTTQESGGPGFHVQQWGSVVGEGVVAAFVILFRAYRVVAPELSVVVKEYTETAYSMAVGEKETILEVHPELAVA